MPTLKEAAYIFDLDGTLANLTHRLHLVRDQGRIEFKPNWTQFFIECINDTPIQEVIDILTTLRCDEYNDNNIIIVSGRDDAVKLQTEAWLDRQGIYYEKLFMRKHGDHRPDDLIKREIYNKEIKPYYNILGVFDDRDRVVAMWRSEGLRCYQVAPGNF